MSKHISKGTEHVSRISRKAAQAVPIKDEFFTAEQWREKRLKEEAEDRAALKKLRDEYKAYWQQSNRI